MREIKEIGLALLILLPLFVAAAACVLIVGFLVPQHPAWLLLFPPVFFAGARGSIYLIER